MKRLLKIFIKNDIFDREKLPDQDKRRFYHRSKIICAAMYRAKNVVSSAKLHTSANSVR